MSLGRSRSRSETDSTQAVSGTIRNTPIISDEYMDFFRGARGQLGDTGLTAPQQQGLDVLSGLVAQNPAQAGLRGAQAGLQGARGGFQGARDALANTARGFGIARGDVRGAGATQRAALTGAGQAVGDIASGMTSQFAQRALDDSPQISNVAVGDVREVAGQQGADFLADYQNPFTEQVVDTTIADAEQALNRRLNIQKMAQAAGGALGGGRQQVAEQDAINRFGRNLAGQIGQLRSQGFQTAAGLGQTDAARMLQAQAANQGVDLSRAAQQAQLSQQSELARAELENQRQMFETQQRMQAIRDLVGQRQLAGQLRAEGAGAFGTAAERGAQLGGLQGEAALAAARAGAEGAGLGVQAANLGLQGAGLTTADAQNLINAGAIGPEQAAVLLGIGTQQFGDLEDRDLTTTGRSTTRGSSTNIALGG
jgi:hypothetical protein